MMPFGKYKGQPLEEIPTPYLVWVDTQCESLEWTTKGLVLAELRKRADESTQRVPRQRALPPPAPVYPARLALACQTVAARYASHPDALAAIEELFSTLTSPEE